jgi:hypothetical protein
MDQLALSVVSVREGTRRVMVQFLHTELASGRMWCQLAKRDRDAVALSNCVRMTGLAIETVGKYMWTTRLAPQELNELTAQLELLKFEARISEQQALSGGTEAEAENLFIDWPAGQK